VEEILKPGENIDSWCGECKSILPHTIETLKGDKPARVQCNTCNAHHAYKAKEPAARTGKPRASRYETLLKGKDKAVARSYSTKDTYSPGDVMEHPTFGFGVATAVRDATKIEVLFENGPKVLVQGR
jgi:hypothetical protein